jgi:ribonuclease HII
MKYNMKVSEIESIFKSKKLNEITEVIKLFEKDNRVAVKNIINKYLKKYEKYNMELKRIEDLRLFERSFVDNDEKLIAGVDEAGRGPLAGPVFTAAVILKNDAKIIGINDSKVLSEEKREQLFFEILKNAVSFSIKYCDYDVIDRINIRKATFKAMVNAIESLNNKPDYVLIDGDGIEGLDIPYSTVISGDKKSMSIAAASILAKVSRDKYIKKLHTKYPQYNFINNKGYGTKEHIQAIKIYGPCPIHRKTFIKNFLK